MKVISSPKKHSNYADLFFGGLKMLWGTDT